MHEILKTIYKVLEKEEFIKPLLRKCAERIEAERVGFWSIKEEVIFCEWLYVKEKEDFKHGLSFEKDKCKEFLKTLEEEGIFESKMAQEDERLSQCIKDYFRINNTNLFLAIPVWFEGRPFGFLSLEKSQRRQWAVFERYKALYTASLISLLLEKQKGDFLLRMYRTLTSFNSIILESKDKEKLLRLFCKVATEEGMFRMAWVGLLDEKGNVKPLCSSGYVENYLSFLKINIYDEKTNKGPTARAIIEDRVQVNNDTETNPAMAPWREEMLKRNYLSSCAYPIRFRGKIIGTINLYSDKKNFFTGEVLKLVEELAEDISFALEYLETLRIKDTLFRAIEEIKDWVMITDKDGYIEYVNPAVEEISGYKREKLIGKRPSIFKSGLHSEDFYKELWDTITSGKVFYAIFINRKKDGSLFYLDSKIVPIRDDKGEISNFVAVGRDITQVKQIEERLRFISNYDPLTGVPNKEHSLGLLEEATKEGESIAVAFVDIYNFSSINLLYGYSVGDKILSSFAERLSKVGDGCGRYGSDEFLVFKRLESPKDLEELTRDILKAAQDLKLTVNIGISIYPLDGRSPSELVEKAILALKQAKGGTSSFAFYERGEEERIVRGLMIGEELERAIERGEFVLHFQPYYSSKDLKLSGAEALIRWNSKIFGLLYPKDFLHLVEKKRFTKKLDYWVFEEAMRLIKSHSISVPIYLNLSPLSIDEDLPDYLKSLIEKYEISPSLINLEITEEAVIKDLERANRILEEVHNLGISIVLDDFGILYSSLSLLSKFPISYLKIDKSFVDRLEDVKTLNIVQHLVSMCKTLNIKTIAEGVEYEWQADLLMRMSCDYLQGYYLSKPITLDKFLDLLKGQAT
ncbi:MAG: EAL domain-containing protein [Aquificaceae bacterium]